MKKAKRILSMLLAILMVLSSMVVTTAVVSAEETATVAEEDHSASLYTTWWSDNAAEGFAGGNGQYEYSPYIIKTPEQLAYFANWLEEGHLNNATSTTYFKLGADINMAGHQWKPIGSEGNTDDYTHNTLNKAVFDGGNHTISNITLTASAAIDGGYNYSNGVGLFARISRSEVKNLNISVKILDPDFGGNILDFPSGANNGAVLNNANYGVAALAGLVYGNSKITNVTADLDLDVRNTGSTYVYAGLVGAAGPASGGPQFDTVTVNGDMYIDAPGVGQYNADGTHASAASDQTSVMVAGVLGWYQCSKITKVTNNADITLIASKGGTRVGGIVAQTYNGPIGSDLYNNGDITVYAATGGESMIGGIFAQTAVLRQTNSSLGTSGVNAPVVNRGAITVYAHSSALHVAGIVAYAPNDSTNIVGYTNDAPITFHRTAGTNFLNMGAIVGYSGNKITLDGCENTANGDITYNSASATHQTYISGLVGRLNAAAKIKNCINRGDVIANDAKPADGKFVHVSGIASITYSDSSTTTANGYSATNTKNYGNVSYTAKSAVGTGAAYVGGFASYMQGSTTAAVFDTCENYGNVSLTFKSTPGNDKHRAGGFVGEMNVGQIKNCTNYGDVLVDGLDDYGGRFGGIAGNFANYSTAFITGTTNKGDVTVTDAPKDRAGIKKDSGGYYTGNRYIGGLVGNHANARVDGFINNVNEGNVTYNAQGPATVGGLAGNASGSKAVVQNSHNKGTITINNLDGTKHRNVGGLYGQLNSGGATLKNCTNEGLVWQKDVYNNANATAGLVGYLGNTNSDPTKLATGTLENCVNNGEVRLTVVATGASNGTRYVGGLVANMQGLGTIINCTNNAPVNYTATEKNGSAIVGGIVAYFAGTPTVKGAINNGTVTVNSTGTVYAGGIIGSLMATTPDVANAVEDCVNYADLTVTGASGVAAAAGICGRTGYNYSATNGQVTFKNCVNLGKIEGYQVYEGGLVGYNAASNLKNDFEDAPDLDGDGNVTEKITVASHYTVYYENCISQGSGTDHALVGRVMSEAVFTNCFGDTKNMIGYRNQNEVYFSNRQDKSMALITINGDIIAGDDRSYNPPTTATVILGTVDGARVRLDSMGNAEVSGLRFDSFVSKESVDEMKALSDVEVSYGTLIAPTANVNLAKVVKEYDKKSALDAITKPGKKTYALVPFEQDFLYEDENNYYFGAAIANIKEKNFNLSYTAIAYITVNMGDFEFTFWADYDDTNADRARSIAYVAGKAFEDRTTEKTTVYGYTYNHLAEAENACYIGNWSLYSNNQLALLRTWSAYDNTGKEIPAGLSVNGVSISEYKIVYAQSPIYKNYGSTSGKTLFGDLGNVNFDIVNYSTPTGEVVSFGDTLLGARYDYDYQTAVRLQQMIAEKYNVTLEIVPDYSVGANADIVSDDIVTPQSTFEILVGFTNRPKSQSAALARMGIDDFTLKIEDDDIIICGGAYGTTWHAVDELEELLATLDSEEGYNLKMAGDLSGSYKMEKIATIGDSITRGSQALPDSAPYINTYGLRGGAYSAFGSAATETYYRYYLSYPANLQRLTWQDAVVYNYGRGSSTAGAYEAGNASNYFANSEQFADCMADSEEIDFDLVFMMHGTNDSTKAGGVSGGKGAYNWNEADKQYFADAVQDLMDKILAKSPNAQFVFNNIPHRFDSDSVVEKGHGTATSNLTAGTNEHNTMAMADIQYEMVKDFAASGYTVYLFNMNMYTRENLVVDGMTCDCEGYNDPTDPDAARPSSNFDSTGEMAAHSYFYNFSSPYGYSEGTHPNFRGYHEMANGVYEVVQYVLFDGEKSAYMIDVE